MAGGRRDHTIAQRVFGQSVLLISSFAVPGGYRPDLGLGCICGPENSGKMADRHRDYEKGSSLGETGVGWVGVVLYARVRFCKVYLDKSRCEGILLDRQTSKLTPRCSSRWFMLSVLFRRPASARFTLSC